MPRPPPLARLAIMLPLALAALATSATAAPPAVTPPPVQGTVTCEGRPVFNALVQAIADPEATAPLGEAFTDGRGHFSLQPRAGAAFLVARRGFRDAQGELLRLSSTPRPLSPRPLELRIGRREVRSRQVPTTPTDLEACADGLAPPDLAEVERAVTAVLAAPPDALPAAVALYREVLGRRGAETTLRVLDAAHKGAETALDLAGMRHLGEVTLAVGQALGAPELRTYGHAWLGVVSLYAGQGAQALPELRLAVAEQQAAAEAETRPGWKRSQQALWSTLLRLTANVASAAGDGAEAARLWTRAAELDAALGRIEEAAESRLNLAEQADLAHDPATAAAQARQVIDVLGELDAPALRGRALVVVAAAAEGAERERLQGQAEQTLAQAPVTLTTLDAQVKLGQQLGKQGNEAAAVRVLTAAITGLDRQPASPQRDTQLWSALGGLGRGDVLRSLGRHEEAVADLRRAIPLQPKALDPKSRGLDAMLLGYSLSDLGRYDEARVALLQASALWRQGGAPADLEMALTLRDRAAWTYLDREPPEPAEALELLDAALEEAERLDAYAVAARLAETAAYACLIDETDPLRALPRGVAYLDRAEARWTAAGDRAGLAQVRKQRGHLERLLGEAQLAAGQDADAEAALRAAIASYEQEGDRAAAEAARDSLAMLLMQQTRWAEAAPLWEAYARWLQTPEAAAAARETLAALPRPTAENRRNLEPARQRAVTLSLLSTCWEAAGRPERATAARRALVAQYVELGEPDEAAEIDKELAIGALVAGDRAGFERSVASLERSVHDGDGRAVLETLRALPDVVGTDAGAARRAVARLARRLAALPDDVDRLEPGQRRGFVQAWATLGALQAQLGDPGTGLASLERASAWAEPGARVALLEQIGKLCFTLGRLQEALDALHEVLALQPQTAQFNKPSHALGTLVQVFDVQWALGDLAGARTTLVEVGELAQRVAALPTLQADDRRTLADAWALLGRQAVLSGQDPDHAIPILRRALELYPPGLRDERSATARVSLAVAELLKVQRGQLAELHERMEAKDFRDTAGLFERHAAALVPLRQRLRKAMDEALEQHAVKALLLGASIVQGPRVAEGSAAPRDAARLEEQTWLRDTLREAHARALRAGRLADLPDLSWALARDLEAAGDVDGAIATYRQAVDEQEVLRSSLASDTRKAELLEGRDEALYGALERLLADRGQAAQALEVSEQRRARALLDVMATGALRDQLGSGEEAPTLALQRLAERMRALAAQDERLDLDLGLRTVEHVDPATGRAKVVAAAPRAGVQLGAGLRGDDPEALMQQLGEARRRLAGSSAELVSLVTAPIVTADELRAAARDRKAALVEWSIHADRLLIYVVRPDGHVDVRKVDVTAEALEGLVREARAGLGASVGLDPTRGAQVWGSAPSSAATARAALEGLYKALVQPIADLLPVEAGATVIAVPHRALMLVPLGALQGPDGVRWVDQVSLSVVPSLGVLRYTAAKAKRAARRGALVVGDPTMPVWQGHALPALPGALREAGAVAKALRGPGVSLLTGEAASETAVRAALSGRRWLHLATHGVTRDDDPGESFVALAPDGQADGLLTLGEVLGLRLNADLVVLSACQTGLGKVSGDGVMGLGRAFLYAGTPRVVVSLWSVPDEPTALLMQTFYDKLRVGMAPAEALRQAMLATRERFPDTASWAAFELIGEPG